jgi:hypothetical protein
MISTTELLARIARTVQGPRSGFVSGQGLEQNKRIQQIRILLRGRHATLSYFLRTACKCLMQCTRTVRKR